MEIESQFDVDFGEVARLPVEPAGAETSLVAGDDLPAESSDLLPAAVDAAKLSAAPEGGSRVEASLQNLAAVLGSGLLGRIRWDEFTHTEVLEKDGIRTELERADITRLMVQCQKLGLAKMSRQTFEEAVHLVAKNNPCDSAKAWLGGLPDWDGQPRIERFLPDYLGTTAQPYELAVGRYWWTASAARILYPGCQADMVPVLVGPQGVRKSTLLRVIVPSPDLCGEASLTDQPARLTRKVLGKMLVAWEEVRGIRGQCDAAEVKTFITLPYVEMTGGAKKGTVHHGRRFIIVGTSNRKDILRDPTGSRRFVPIDVPQTIDIDKVEADKLQLWAEARHVVTERVAQGQAPVDYEDAQRLAEQEHAAYFREGRWVGEKSLLKWLQGNPAPFTAEDALQEIGFRTDQITLREKREMAETLRQLGVKRGPTRIPGSNNPVQRWKTN